MLPIGKPQEGQLFWMLPLAVGWMLLGSACGSKFSSSDLHLLSPTSGAPLPSALPRPDHPQGLHGPRHHQPSVPLYRSPTGLRAGHGESPQQLLDVTSFSTFLSVFSLCPFIIMMDGVKVSHVWPPLYLFLFITSSLPSTFCPFVFFFLFSLTLPSFLPPWHRQLTIADSHSASHIVYEIIRLIVSEEQ